jgi:NifU-like protein involved in Fe-S cluster formation
MTAPAASLYSREILRLAMALPHDDRLSDPLARSATRRAPVCGSEVTADVTLTADGRIAAIAFRARACALGQASSALLREHGVGLDMAEVAAARDVLKRFLDGDDVADLPWTALDAFRAAQQHSARHGAILLPYDALIAAMQGAN